MKILSLVILLCLSVDQAFCFGVSTSSRLASIAKNPSPATKSALFSSASAKEDGAKKNLPVPTLSSWDPTNWTPKRIHNSPLFRSAAILLSLGVGGSGNLAKVLSTKSLATLHLLSFATWFGTVVYTTFIAGITMYKNLPRQTFGKLQSKLFPKYFMLSNTMIILQLLTVPSASAVGAKRATFGLGVALAMTLMNQFWLEPVSTDVMFKRYDLENSGDTESADYKALASKFGKFHGISSLTNLIALCGAIVHGSYLGSVIA